MTDAYTGEIRVFGFGYAPRNWALCNGQLLPISQNAALFSILGTQYGGNGTSNFALPNFNNYAANHQGSGPGLSSYVVGEISGDANVTLSVGEIPQHNHALSGGQVTPQNLSQNVPMPGNTAVFAVSGPQSAYTDQVQPATSFAPQAITMTGGSQPHENRQPFLALNFSICINGVFPSRN